MWIQILPTKWQGPDLFTYYTVAFSRCQTTHHWTWQQLECTKRNPTVPGNMLEHYILLTKYVKRFFYMLLSLSSSTAGLNWSLQSNTGFRSDNILTLQMSLQINREFRNDHLFVARWILKILIMQLQSLITNKITGELPSTLLSPKIWATRTPTVIPSGHKTPIAPRMLRGEISVRYIGMVLVTRPGKREHTSQTSELCRPTHT
jgi:hypothetical protein